MLSYNKYYNSPKYDRYQLKCGQNLNYYSPGTNFAGIEVTERDSYVIDNEDILRLQLSEMFNRNSPEILYNGEYISKGVVNVNKQHMYEYLSKYNNHIFIPEPNDYNRYLGDSTVVDYITWKFVNNLNEFTGGMGRILAFRLRYTFFFKNPLYSVKSVIWTVYKNLMDYIICYSFYENANGCDAIDIILSNATYRRLKGKRGRTLSGYMNYITDRLNSEIDLAVKLIDPRSGERLNLYKL